MMALRSEALVATTLPRRYLVQLCKHFQHKIPVELHEESPAHGHIAFPFGGACTLSTEPDALRLVSEAPDPAALGRTQQVVADHLLRFAFRDTLVVEWRPLAEHPAG